MTKLDEIEIVKGWVRRGIAKLGTPKTINQKSILALVKAGCDEEQKFISEMVAMETPRAKKARQVLTAVVHGEAFNIGTRSRLLEHLENEADDNWRKQWICNR